MNTLAPHSRRLSVLIVGFGQMGHAMQTLLKNRADLCIWRVTPKNLRPPATVLAAAEQTDCVLLCVPTIAVATTLTRLQSQLGKHAVVLSIAKGLDETGHTAADILKTSLGSGSNWGVLGGPMIANELRAGRCGFAELGCSTNASLGLVRRLFRNTPLYLSANFNPRAVSWCGVLKNVYVPLIGMGDGLGWGDNLRGQLISAVLKEINLLVQRFCGLQHAADGTAGLADLVTTATSRSSHHRQLGMRVARGNLRIPESEGVHTLRVLMRRKIRLSIHKLPLLQVAMALVQRPRTAHARLADWIASNP